MEKEGVLKERKGTWKDKIEGSSVDYVKKMRGGWGKRAKRLGI